jgi:hypothetical protein
MYDEFQTQQFWNNMRKSQLKQLIKEEFNKILNEENGTDIKVGDTVKYENQEWKVEKIIPGSPSLFSLSNNKGTKTNISVNTVGVTKVNEELSFEDIDYYADEKDNFEKVKDVVFDTIENKTGNLKIDFMYQLVELVANSETGGSEGEAKKYITDIVNQDPDMVKIINDYSKNNP